MRRNITALILVVCLLGSLAAGFTATAAAYDGQVNVDRIVEAGKKLFSAHEGVYDTVVQNDMGAVGMGIMGWRGPKALQLMKMICAQEPELSQDILGDELYSEIVNASDTLVAWNYRVFTADEAARARILLSTDTGIAAQDELARLDITRQIGEAWSAGVRTDAAILYFCSISNHYGPGGAQTFMKYIRETMGITKNDTINSLEEFHNAVIEAAKTYSYVNSTLAYRTKIYNYIKNTLGWDTTGAQPAAPLCPDCPSAGFTDVPPKGDWAHDGIDYAIAHGLFNGTSATTFSPNKNMTRAMLVTVLYRMEGTPAVEGELQFTDVSEDSYYATAVQWAYENNIVNGIGENQFAPDDVVTREQMATILYRFTLKRTTVTQADTMLLDGYGDARNVSGYAVDALAWAVSTGLIRGDFSTGELMLNPKGSATRAQVATILMRYLTSTE